MLTRANGFFKMILRRASLEDALMQSMGNVTDCPCARSDRVAAAVELSQVRANGGQAPCCARLPVGPAGLWALPSRAAFAGRWQLWELGSWWSARVPSGLLRAVLGEARAGGLAASVPVWKTPGREQTGRRRLEGVLGLVWCDARARSPKLRRPAVILDAFPKAAFPWRSARRKRAAAARSGPGRAGGEAPRSSPSGCWCRACCFPAGDLPVAVRTASTSPARGPASALVLPRRAGLLLAEAIGSSEWILMSSDRPEASWFNPEEGGGFRCLLGLAINRCGATGLRVPFVVDGGRFFTRPGYDLPFWGLLLSAKWAFSSLCESAKDAALPSCK